MRILIVHPKLSVMGGGERVAIHSIKEALNEGHEVYLATEHFEFEAFEDFFGVEGLLDNIHMLTYAPFRPLTHRAVLYQRLAYNQIQLRKILSNSPPFDLVLNTAEVANQPATKSPSVQYCYFPEHFKHLSSDGSSRLWGLYYWPARVFYHSRVSHIDRLLAVSDFTKGIVRKIWGRESTTLYPPCPIQLYKNLHSQKEDLVVTIGRVSPGKRMELFLEIARRLPTLDFAIIGSIPADGTLYYERLRGTAPDNVSFVISPLRKAKDLLSRAKVYVHCAKDEHFGITIVEAMAAGCVPIVHDSGGPREIVSEEVGYKWALIDQAVTEVSSLVKDDGARGELSKAAIARANLYGPEEFQSGLRKVFEAFNKRV